MKHLCRRLLQRIHQRVAGLHGCGALVLSWVPSRMHVLRAWHVVSGAILSWP